MSHYTFHVLGVPFTATARKYLGDAMTQNVFNMCRMLVRLGHKVYHYGNHGSDVDCFENVEIFTANEMLKIYDNGADVRLSPNGFYAKGTKALYEEFIRRVTQKVGKRKKTNDFLLGVRYPHPEVTKHHADMIYVHHSVGHMEPGPPATIFASEYIRNLTLGVKLAQTQNIGNDPRSAVIPHMIYSEEFEPSYESENYFLFLGRLSPEKGLDIAIRVCSLLEKKLIIAGQGDISGYPALPACCEYIGYVDDIKQRNALLRKAEALIMPSRYEAFGMAAVEALMSGVPLLTSDFASFPEINQHGITGYRCSTVAEFVVAGKNIRSISRKKCRNVAEEKFSFQALAPLYRHYFERLFALHTGNNETPWFNTEDLIDITHQ